MKNRTIRVVAAILVCVSLLTVLAACGGKLSGTYETEPVFGAKSVYKFKSNGEVSWSISGALETSGTYKIDGEKLIITVAGVEVPHTFEKNGNTLKIDGVEYKKK